MTGPKLGDWFIDCNDGKVIKIINLNRDADYPFIVQPPGGSKRVYGPEHFKHEHIKLPDDICEKLDSLYPKLNVVAGKV